MSTKTPTICESLKTLVLSGLFPETIEKIRGSDVVRLPNSWEISTEEGSFILSGEGARAIRVLRSWSRGKPDRPFFPLTPGGETPAPAEWIHAILAVDDGLKGQDPDASPSVEMLTRAGLYYAWLQAHPEAVADPDFQEEGNHPAEIAAQVIWRVERGLAPCDGRYHQAQADQGQGLTQLLSLTDSAEVRGVLHWLDTRTRSAEDLWRFLLRRPERVLPWAQFYEQVYTAEKRATQTIAERLPPVDPHVLSRASGTPPEEPVAWSQTFPLWVEEKNLEKDRYIFLVQNALQDLPRPWSGADLADYYEALSPLYRGRVFRTRWNQFRVWLARTQGLRVAKAPGSRKGDASRLSVPAAVAKSVVALADRIPAAQISRARWGDVLCDERRAPGDRMRWAVGARQTLLGLREEKALSVLRDWATNGGRIVEDPQALLLPVRPGADIAFTPAAIRFLVREARKGKLAQAVRYPIRVPGVLIEAP